MSTDLLDQIKKITKRITKVQLEQLLLEEEMLLMVVRSTDKTKTLELKSSAFKRMKEINKLQLELLGEPK